jgi:hypothetical protein
MSRSTVPALKRFRGPAVLFAVLALALLLPSLASACGEEGGEDTGPIVSNVKVSPPSLPQEGGQVAVYATVEDDCGVFMVYSGMYGPDVFNQSIQMLPWEIAPNGVATYRGEATVPPNNQEYAINYGFIVQATDTNGAFIETYAGDVEVAGVPQFDEAPYVSEIEVSPRQLPSMGGPVTITATATDNRSVSYVYATVTVPSGGREEFELEPISSSRFRGVFHVPRNRNLTVGTYRVTVTAQDDIGQEGSADGGTFSLPPITGKLNAWTSVGSYFGKVNVWESAKRFVVVHNDGSQGIAPIEAIIHTSGAPFYLPAAKSPQGIRFTLQPSQSRTFAVEFRPHTPGFRAGSVTISRPDGAQPDVTVALSGSGYKPPPHAP